MRVFLTKAWGFTPETYPVLGFSGTAGRDKFIRESGPQDWVVLAGTRTAPTAEHERGKLLGMVRLGSSEVEVEPLLAELGTVTITPVSALTQARAYEDALAANRVGATGPPPSKSRSASDRIAGSGSVYLLRLEGGRDEVWKVGYSAQPEKRVREVYRVARRRLDQAWVEVFLGKEWVK